jgi:hypothetical protein
MLQKVFISIGIAFLFAPKVLATHPREIIVLPVNGSRKTVCENDSFFAPKGSRIILDVNQGVLVSTTNASIDIPICRHENGGYQTLFRVKKGFMRFDIRKFTNPQSFFKIVGVGWKSAMLPGEESSVQTIGTEFTIEAIEDGIRVGMDGGRIQVRSGGVSAIVAVGQGADLQQGKPPQIYTLDYILGVKDLKVEELNGQNIVTGRLMPGNSIDPEDGSIEFKNQEFKLTTTRNYLIIRNANGTSRFYPLPRSVRPFRD